MTRTLERYRSIGRSCPIAGERSISSGSCGHCTTGPPPGRSNLSLHQAMLALGATNCKNFVINSAGFHSLLEGIGCCGQQPHITLGQVRADWRGRLPLLLRWETGCPGRSLGRFVIPDDRLSSLDVRRRNCFATRKIGFKDAVVMPIGTLFIFKSSNAR